MKKNLVLLLIFFICYNIYGKIEKISLKEIKLEQELELKSMILSDALAEKGLDLYDIKFEFGIDKDGEVILIDEIASGNMRVYKAGKIVDPMDLTEMVFA